MEGREAIPQPRGEMLIGNLRDVDSKAPVQSLIRLASAFGEIFQLDFFGRRLIVTGSHRLVDELCDEARFDKRVHAALLHIRDFAGDGLFTAKTREPNWAMAHRLLMPAFGPLGVRGMFDRMFDIADQTLVRWERFGPQSTIDVADSMTRLTLDTIALCAFDYRFNSFYRSEMHPFVGAMVDALSEAGQRARRPEFVNRMLLHSRRRYADNIRLMHAVADALIVERRNQASAGPDGAGQNGAPQGGMRQGGAERSRDLLDLMLQGVDPETGERLSDENIRFQLVTFLIAGHETTSGLLSFVLYLLLRNPAALRAARDEVDAVLGSRLPKVEDLAKLRLVEQALMESLRIWPTAPAFALRAYKDTTIGGRYPILTTDTVMVLLPVLHRDPTVWGDDAEAFRPERFSPQQRATLPPNAWKPFGNGQRACIGRAFAMQEAQLVLAMILQRFDVIDDDPSYTLTISETLTLKPEGFRIRVKPRGSRGFALRSGLSTASISARTSTSQHRPSSPTPAPAPASPSGGQLPTLLVLYGSNSGASEAFAARIASDAPAHGFTATVGALDDFVDAVPANTLLVVVTASYEGQPPDNARQFCAWLDKLSPDQLRNLPFAVFGCGDRQWARTYQAIPRRIDAALQAAGGTRIVEFGAADASGDFFGHFDEWYAGLWPAVSLAAGVPQQTDVRSPALQVEVVTKGRPAILRQVDLQPGTVLENRELVDTRAPLGRSKRHIEIALPPGMSYRAGDYLAVLARNPLDTVTRVLRRFGFEADTQVVLRGSGSTVSALPVGHPVPVADLLAHYVELSQPATRTQTARLAQAAACPLQRDRLQQLATEAGHDAEVLGQRLSVLDLLERHPSCDIAFADYQAMLPSMRARQYSISSSPLWNPQRCTLTVSVVDAAAFSGQGRYRGVASSFLAAAEAGTRLSVAVRPSNIHFHLPASPRTPIVMACAGTGLAPFRGFLQERAIQAAAGQQLGPALLYFGCDHPDVDYLYRDELEAWQAAGVVSLRPTFAEAPLDGHRFVQDRIWADREELVTLEEAGAHFYVCGDGRRLAPAVRETFLRIYREASGASAGDAERWIEAIERETGRYVADVFS